MQPSCAAEPLSPTPATSLPYGTLLTLASLHADAGNAHPAPVAQPTHRQLEPAAHHQHPAAPPQRAPVALSPRPGPPAQRPPSQPPSQPPRLSPRGPPVSRAAEQGSGPAAAAAAHQPVQQRQEHAGQPHRGQAGQTGAPSTVGGIAGRPGGAAEQAAAAGLHDRRQQGRRPGAQMLVSPRSHTEPPPR